MKHNHGILAAVAVLSASLAIPVSAAGPVGQGSPASLKVRAAAIAGPSGIGMAWLFSNPPDLGKDVAVTFEACSSVDALLPKLINGDIDIGILPPNVAAKLYTMDKNTVVAGAVVGNGMLSLVTADPAIARLDDLAGKTVSVAGQGSTPEYVARTLFAKRGMPEGAVTLDFSVPTPEIAAALVSGKIGYAIVPEPFATLAVQAGVAAGKPVRRAVLFRDEWKSSGLGADFPMTLCVIRKDFSLKHPDVARKFLEAYESSIAWTVAHPAEAGPLVESAGIGIKAALASRAIPACNLAFVPAIAARDDIERLLGVFLANAPESVGRRLPDDGFYFR